MIKTILNKTEIKPSSTTFKKLIIQIQISKICCNQSIHIQRYSIYIFTIVYYCISLKIQSIRRFNY